MDPLAGWGHSVPDPVPPCVAPVWGGDAFPFDWRRPGRRFLIIRAACHFAARFSFSGRVHGEVSVRKGSSWGRLINVSGVRRTPVVHRGSRGVSSEETGCRYTSTVNTRSGYRSVADRQDPVSGNRRVQKGILVNLRFFF